jgi:hypothetical protein
LEAALLLILKKGHFIHPGEKLDFSHLTPKKIWGNKSFENITQFWLAGDHYNGYDNTKNCFLERKDKSGSMNKARGKGEISWLKNTL